MEAGLKKKAEREIICMPTSIKLLRFYNVFPQSDQVLKPGNKSYNHVELDVIYIASIGVSYGIICYYVSKIKSAIQLYLFFSNFEEFGKPIEFDEINQKYNRYSQYHYCYAEFAVFVVLLGSNIFKSRQCRVENEQRHLHEVCGLFSYTWMPFNIDFFPVKQIYLFIQLIGGHFVYAVVLHSAWMVLETIEHIVIRIRHVAHLFNEALAAQDPEERREKFNSVVRYHIQVLGLQSKMNHIYSVFMFIIIIMNGAIMGYGVYAYMKEGNISPIVIALEWFIGSFIICHGGQRIQDESISVGTALYNTDWSRCETNLKKDIMFVLMRCQQPMVLKAASFGIMDHAIFLAVAKATYSYITLLSQ
nr:putative odorant receptor 85d [Leptinotarsa decemlineata]